MRHMKRANIYKASNVTFDPKTIKAYSYDWWCFVKVINGKVIFNDYNYSNTTIRHQRKVRRLMRELGIKIDLIIETRSSLNSSTPLCDAIFLLQRKNQKLVDLINKPRTHKAKNEERQLQIIKNNDKIKELLNIREVA